MRSNLAGRLAQAQRARAAANPWMRAAELRRARGLMRSALTEVGLQVYTVPDGSADERSVHLLAHLGWLIGMGSEVAHAVLGRSDPLARRLHGSLRTVQQMCLAGYAWRAAHADPLDDAARKSHELLLAHAEVAIQMRPGADYLCARIRSRSVTAEDVAGAELYQQERAA